MSTRVYVPETLDNTTEMFTFLDKIGLPLPAMARTMAGDGLGLRAAGTTFTTAQVDEALAKHEIDAGARLRIKIALAHHKLLRR